MYYLRYKNMSIESFIPASEEEAINPSTLAQEARGLAKELGTTEKELEAIPYKPVGELREEAESAISRLEVQELSRKAEELLIQLGKTEADIANAKLSLKEISTQLSRLLANFQE
jgi:hypothetical protein